MESTAEKIDILYLEDDEVDIQSAQRAFQKVSSSIKIEVAKNGNQALDKLYGRNNEKKIHPKVILLDINLPKMNGIEFLKDLRADQTFTDIEVYVLTAAYTSQDKLALEPLNIRGHLIKPLDYGEAIKLFWVLQSL
ncbi:chemotaxis protein CheY [Legionella norrlandica]|uniref:Chemotaxis protein CheY n=1 Tax=Legionella norrlandica TaxID=1498499 RepID=A0A0A2SRK5_9GAMM|nr:response regulator [Legionella norrlandica]KGP63362.1 chemotaxis protein CheY [Legionella norrlandica]